ncbi:GNAT family N-acetyltransferase [Actinoplanes sp. NPDC051859]|uniref:GNAT family N-acetyltransferase n=1 Tax=Actinoplanes sp. NPDC051859 TaxID=3363909 RepID=UPI0037ABC44F
MELLHTSRTLLRRWQQADLAAYFEIYSRWEIMRWLGPHPRRVVADLDDARQRFARRQAREAGLPLPFGLWALVVPSTGAAPRGTVLLLPLHDAAGLTTEVEIGWNLHPDHQGRGLVTEAAQALLTVAAQAGHTSVLALTDQDNIASQAVARRLGMRDEGRTDRWFATTTRQFRWCSP